MKIENATTGTLVILDLPGPTGEWGLTVPPGVAAIVFNVAASRSTMLSALKGSGAIVVLNSTDEPVGPCPRYHSDNGGCHVRLSPPSDHQATYLRVRNVATVTLTIPDLPCSGGGWGLAIPPGTDALILEVAASRSSQFAILVASGALVVLGVTEAPAPRVHPEHRHPVRPYGYAEFVGAPGPQGASGAQGAQGSVGLQGLQGLMGFQGRVGAAGAQGAQGPQGGPGNLGATGSYAALKSLAQSIPTTVFTFEADGSDGGPCGYGVYCGNQTQGDGGFIFFATWERA